MCKNQKTQKEGEDMTTEITPIEAYKLALTKGSRTTYLEPLILSDPSLAGLYAQYVIGGRWPEAEEIIKQDVAAYKKYKLFLRFYAKQTKGKKMNDDLRDSPHRPIYHNPAATSRVIAPAPAPTLTLYAPRLLIPYKVFLKIRSIVKIADEEIGWLGLVTKAGNTFTINEIFIPKQRVSSGTCELDESSIGEIANSLVQAGRADDLNRIRLWGHSHHTMGVFASGQDDTQGEQLAKQCNDYFVRMICNKRNEIRTDIYLPQLGFIVNDIKHEVVDDDEIDTEIRQEIQEKVSKISYSYSTFTKDEYYNDDNANYWRQYYNKNDNYTHTRSIHNMTDNELLTEELTK